MSQGQRYLWNRAERVQGGDMPHVVINAFKVWRNDLKREWKHLSKHRKRVLKYRIVHEQDKMNDNLHKLGYEKYQD